MKIKPFRIEIIHPKGFKFVSCTYAQYHAAVVAFNTAVTWLINGELPACRITLFIYDYIDRQICINIGSKNLNYGFKTN